MKFPIEFTECPICHETDTVCRLGVIGEPSLPEGIFVSLEKVFTPIQQPTQMLSPLVRGILVHYDVCANCGHRYCTKAEKVSFPVTVQQAPVNPPKFDPKSRHLSS